MAISNRLKSAKVWLGLFWLGCAFFSSACAHHDDSADDSSQQHQHHGGGGGGRNGHGQGGIFDQSNPSGSPSPVPGE
jgi:Spy/CpxP family protein refolding chaperone